MKTLAILRHEVQTLVSRFSFWFGVLGIPLIGFLLISGIGMLNQGQAGSPVGGSPLSGMQQLFNAPAETRPRGYVDQAGLIKAFPQGFPKHELISYPSQAAAQRDLEAGKIAAFYVIPPDYVQAGKIYAYMPQYNLVASEEGSTGLNELINFNLLGGDNTLAGLVRDPLPHLETVSLATQVGGVKRERNSELSFFLPYSVMMLFFFTIMGSSTMLLNSLAKEKENRIMEVLMASASPRQLLLGKIAGLGLVGLLQVIIWGASAITLLRLSGRTFQLPPSLLLQPSLLAWGVVFFVLGYLVYASLMAGVGALVPSLREASQVTFIIMLPMMAPLFIISALIAAPSGPIAVAFSLFPFTAPTTMMLRLAASDVPIWQILASIALLAATALLTIRAVAGMFRAQTIMSGQAFNVKRFFLALVGKI